MTKVKDKKTFKLDLVNKAVQKLIDDSVKPMSISQIKEKFNLSFPFKVKRVQDTVGAGTFQGISTISSIFIGITKRSVTNNYLITNNQEDNTETLHMQLSEVPDYILFE